MFIRKKHNKPGSTSIHIVRKEAGRQVHVLSIGSATSEQELIELEQVALDKPSTLLNYKTNLSLTMQKMKPSFKICCPALSI